MNNKGQSIREYAALLIFIVFALLAVQPFLKRNVQYRLKFFDQVAQGHLYSPGATTSNITVTNKIIEKKGFFPRTKDADACTVTTTKSIHQEVDGGSYEEILPFTQEPKR